MAPTGPHLRCVDSEKKLNQPLVRYRVPTKYGTTDIVLTKTSKIKHFFMKLEEKSLGLGGA